MLPITRFQSKVFSISLATTLQCRVLPECLPGCSRVIYALKAVGLLTSAATVLLLRLGRPCSQQRTILILLKPVAKASKYRTLELLDHHELISWQILESIGNFGQAPDLEHRNAGDASVAVFLVFTKSTLSSSLCLCITFCQVASSQYF